MIDRRQISKLYSTAKLSETEQSVLEYLINNVDQLSNEGIRNVAQACYTSMTTVMRLAKKLGYSGYREMVFNLQHLQSASQEIGHDLANNRVHFTYRSDDLKLLVDALSQNHVIGVNGEGYSRIIAGYVQHKLTGIGKTAVMQDYLETDQFINTFAEKLDLMILISKSGQTKAIVEMADSCREANVLTAAFTGNPNSELAQIVDVLLVVKDEHPFDTKNVKPNCFAGYCILAFEELLSLSMSVEL